jgi:hypothetical protein
VREILGSNPSADKRETQDFGPDMNLFYYVSTCVLNYLSKPVLQFGKPNAPTTEFIANGILLQFGALILQYLVTTKQALKQKSNTRKSFLLA